MKIHRFLFVVSILVSSGLAASEEASPAYRTEFEGIAPVMGHREKTLYSWSFDKPGEWVNNRPDVFIEHTLTFYPTREEGERERWTGQGPAWLAKVVYVCAYDEDEDSGVRTPRGCYVTNVRTVAKAQRKGLAYVLMNIMGETAHAENQPWIRLHSTEMGKTLYEKLGMKPLEQTSLDKTLFPYLYEKP